MYVTDDAGSRIVCSHPAEPATVFQVTGLKIGEAMKAGRTGFNSHCACLACFEQFNLDLYRDLRRCPKCASTSVKSAREFVDSSCPKCGAGTIRRSSPIRWKLDPDRATLPVPQIVKDLVAFNETGELPNSLREVHEVISFQNPGAGIFDMQAITVRLLDWWLERPSKRLVEGTPTLGSLDVSRLWVQALKYAVEAVPELSRLMRWEGNSCNMNEEIGPMERRGIKNYVREHYQVVVSA